MKSEIMDYYYKTKKHQNFSSCELVAFANFSSCELIAFANFSSCELYSFPLKLISAIIFPFDLSELRLLLVPFYIISPLKLGFLLST